MAVAGTSQRTSALVLWHEHPCTADAAEPGGKLSQGPGRPVGGTHGLPGLASRQHAGLPGWQEGRHMGRSFCSKCPPWGPAEGGLTSARQDRMWCRPLAAQRQAPGGLLGLGRPPSGPGAHLTPFPTQARVGSPSEVGALPQQALPSTLGIGVRARPGPRPPGRGCAGPVAQPQAHPPHPQESTSRRGGRATSS